jgi:serpin B
VDGLSEIEKLLSAAALDEWCEKLEKYLVEVSLPKFRTSAEFSLKENLVDMGMPLPFDPQRADFSAMTTDGSALYIGEVVHKAYVDVDEKGTEAAAATAIVMAPGAGALPKDLKRAEFRADHPFIFLIRESATGSILFMGRVAKPTLSP